MPAPRPRSTQWPASSSANTAHESSSKVGHNPKHQKAGHSKPHQTHRHPKLPAGYFIALQREEMQLHPPDHRCKLPQPGNLDKPLPTPPTGSNLHNKEEPQTSSIQKGHPKPRNLNKMKKQRNIQQVKEHDKHPTNQTKEEEIESLPEKEFIIMIVKMIKNLENKMELQINRLDRTIEKMQEMFNKDLEEKRVSQ